MKRMRFQLLGGFKSLLFCVLLLIMPTLGMAQNSFMKGQPVYPAFEGWRENPDGTINFMFGYFNENWEEQHFVPIGEDNFITPGSPYKKDRNQRVKKKDAKKSKKKNKKGKKTKPTDVGDIDGKGSTFCPRSGPSLSPKSKLFLRLACSHFCSDGGCCNGHPESDKAAKAAIGGIATSKYFRYRIWQSLPGCKAISDELVGGLFSSERSECLVQNNANRPPKDVWQSDIPPSAASAK